MDAATKMSSQTDNWDNWENRNSVEDKELHYEILLYDVSTINMEKGKTIRFYGIQMLRKLQL